VNVDIKFTRSKAKDAINVQLSNDPDATKIQLTEQQFKDRYPLDYNKLIDECRERYSLKFRTPKWGLTAYILLILLHFLC
jgi:hypothetical protein